MSNLYNKSIQVVLQNQTDSGAYIACRAFPSYRFCWLRDGSFSAYAMDLAGKTHSAEAFYRWVGRTIKKFEAKITVIESELKSGQKLGKDDFLHTRFTIDSDETNDDAEWGNFQVDGYGTWLWGLGEHVRLTSDDSILQELREAISITVHYLDLVWQLPNYDCWEEFPDYLHTYSLGAVYAGLQTAARFVAEGRLDPFSTPVAQLAEEVKFAILQRAVKGNKLVKNFPPITGGLAADLRGNDNVDASLIGMGVPYGVLQLNDPIFQSTIAAIERDLHRQDGGVYRYNKDVYYGGGEWVLLSAWLGWYYVSIGKVKEAESLRDWIESQADEDGNLAEQVADHALYPDQYAPWIAKWGPIASPLTWSHAMYIILIDALNKGK